MLSKKGINVLKSLRYIFPTLEYFVLADRDDDWVKLWFSGFSPYSVSNKYIEVDLRTDKDEIVRRLVLILPKEDDED